MKFLHVALGAIFLFGLLPLSNHMLPMQEMHTAVNVSLSSMTQEKTGDYLTGSCCEAIGSSLLACDFMDFQSAYIDRTGGSDQVAHSIPVVQPIYIEILAPPPKA